MLFERQHEYPSQWKASSRMAIEWVADNLDIHRETLRVWSAPVL